MGMWSPDPRQVIQLQLSRNGREEACLLRVLQACLLACRSRRLSLGKGQVWPQDWKPREVSLASACSKQRCGNVFWFRTQTPSWSPGLHEERFRKGSMYMNQQHGVGGSWKCWIWHREKLRNDSPAHHLLTSPVAASLSTSVYADSATSSVATRTRKWPMKLAPADSRGKPR